MATCADAQCHGDDGCSGPAPNFQGTISRYSDGTGEMPAQNLTDQELADVLAFLRDVFP